MRPGKNQSRQSGMTLIELMVSMVIGTVMVAGALTVFQESRRTFRNADSIARLQDNVRFALDAFGPDIQLAGFWGMHSEPLIVLPGAVQVTCAGAGAVQATSLALDIQNNRPLESRDDVYDLACGGTSPRVGSDVLMVRHASQIVTDIGDLQAGQVYVQSTPSASRLFDNAADQGLGAPSEFRAAQFHAYYVGDSTFTPDTPALRRLTLVDGGAQGRIEDQEIIPGVENLQVQFGLDTNAQDGVVDRYVDGDHPAMLDPANRVIAARLWMLVRGETNETGLGFVDNQAYQPADANLGPIIPGADDYPQGFRRVAVTKTVVVRN